MANFLQRLFTSSSGDFSSIRKEARRLPDIMPADFKILVAEFEIANNTVFVKGRSRESERSFQFEISAEQTEELFRVLKENKFDRIKEIEDVRLDAGSDWIRVDWGNTYIAKGYSQTSYIDKKWEDAYDECKGKLVGLLRKSVKPYLKPVKIVLSEQLLSADQNYYIHIRDLLTPYYYTTKPDKVSFENYSPPVQSDQAFVIPGFTELKVSTYLNNSYGEYLALDLHFPEGDYSSLTLHIYSEGDRIVHRLEFPA